MLKIDSLTYSYGSDTTINYKDWQVDSNDHALILGNSGSGKTTLLHLIGALLKPTSGSIRINGDVISEMPTKALDRYRGENIGIIFQNAHLIRSLTVRENLLLAQDLGKGKIDLKSVDEIMERLSIADLKHRKIHQISQGQAQRVSIGRALLNHPKLLLVDEPTASLDDVNCERVIQLLKEQATMSGASLIIATHDQRVKSSFENTMVL